ncbi:MAG TPA: hypothetical protein VL403_15450 [Candidatus Kryptonia bacterium]|nr:hypothetical protein [Candidatus Kryptonia bacterium]
MNQPPIKRMLIVALSLPALFVGPAHAATKCTLKFKLQSWSAFYKAGSGSGTITCDNGQSAGIAITTTGGGLTAGASKIRDGSGTFSAVAGIDELFGTYAAAEAHAGAVESSTAQVVTKGSVSLALSGTGQGVDLGVAFGKFTIRRRRASPR